MSDSLELLTNRARAGLARPAAPDPTVTLADDDEDSCAAFGYLRGIRDRSLTLELRFADGNSEALPYSWLGPVRFDPSLGLLLKFVGDLVHLVLIEGSNLNSVAGSGGASLYDRGILRHRVVWIREMTRTQVQRTVDGETMIERIRVHSHRPDEEPKGIDWLESFEK